MGKFKKWFRMIKYNLGFHSSWQEAEFERQMRKAFNKGKSVGKFEADYRRMGQ